MALDFVSLLLSQTTPVQASLTISPALRDATGLGTLGADKIADSRTTHAQKLDTEKVVKGWKLQSLNENADSILKSAEKLEKEIDAETKYWQQLVEVDAQGWAVCPLPQERHTLGVRFGFIESAPQFTNRSVAALRRQQDGSIALDQGISEKVVQRLRVRVQANGETTGSWTTMTNVPDDSPILPLIKRARDAIFTDELWQELNRESRVLASLGVRSTGSTITCPISATKTLILDLLSQSEDVISDDNNTRQASTRDIDDDIAHGVWLSLHLLLSSAHKEKLHRRSQKPQPISLNKISQAASPPLALLRPLLARITHQTTISSLTSFFTCLNEIVNKTGLTSEAFTIKEPLLDRSKKAVAATAASVTTGTTSSAAIAQIFTSLHTTFDLPLPQLTSNTVAAASEFKDALTVHTRTLLRPLVESRFQIQATPDLIAITPIPATPSGLGGSSGLREVLGFVGWAISCAITTSVRIGHGSATNEKANPTDANKSTAKHEQKWIGTYDPCILRSATGKLEVAFHFLNATIHEAARLEMKAKDGRGHIDVYTWSDGPGGEGRGVYKVLDAFLEKHALDTEVTEGGLSGAVDAEMGQESEGNESAEF